MIIGRGIWGEFHWSIHKIKTLKRINSHILKSLYIVTLALCFLFFAHTDALITNIQSYIFFPHLSDFYDFSSTAIATAAYLPSIYSLLAIWNLPLTIFHFINNENLLLWATTFPNYKINFTEYLIFTSWYKFGIIMLNVITFIYIKKIRQLIKSSYKSELIYITSPFVIFSSIIFSGYDIFSVLFTLMGFYYFLEKKMLKSSILFSIAITFKFFALLVFIPLILFGEKKLISAIKYTLIALSVSILIAVPYTKNIYFFKSIFLVAKNKFSYGQISLMPFIFLISYLSICIYAFKQDKKNKVNFYKTAIFLAYLSYAVLFLTIKFHPQWILLIVPFIALTYAYEKNKANQISLIEGIGFLAFISLTINIWKNNVDQKMIAQGPISALLNKPQFLIADFFNFHSIKPFLLIIFYLYLAHPLYLKYFNITKKENLQYLYARYIVLYVFMISSFLTTITTPNTVLIPPNQQDIYQKSLKCLYSECFR